MSHGKWGYSRINLKTQNEKEECSFSFASYFVFETQLGTVGRDVDAADPIIGFSECIITVKTQPSSSNTKF